MSVFESGRARGQETHRVARYLDHSASGTQPDGGHGRACPYDSAFPSIVGQGSVPIVAGFKGIGKPVAVRVRSGKGSRDKDKCPGKPEGPPRRKAFPD